MAIQGWTVSVGGAGAAINITLLRGNQLQISNTIVARGGHKVTWNVTNSSGHPEAVRIEDFGIKNAAPPAPPSRDTPLDDNSEVIDFGVIADGDAAVQVTKIKGSKRDYRGAWVYKYTLVIGTTRIDPELVIEWP